MSPSHPGTAGIRRRRVGVDYALAGLAVGAPFLGGATGQWAQACVVLGVAFLLSIDPPRRWPERVAAFLALGLAALAAVAFLPASWFPAPGWRTALVPDPGFPVAGTRTPQPWMSLQRALLLGAGLVWMAALLARDWRVGRDRLLRVYGFGIGTLALVCLGFYSTGTVPAFWPADAGFGPFPNRNQTAGVLALGAFVQLVLVFQAFQRRSLSGCLWLVLTVATAVGVVITGSRAGVLILFGSALGWMLWGAWRARRIQHAALALAALLAGLTAFMLAGGRAWERLHRILNPSLEQAQDLRVPIQLEGLALLREAGWTGVGPGNFAPAFARYRSASLTEAHVVHPESDWLWLGIELGWLAPAGLLGGLAFWLWKHRPRRGDPEFHLRSALVVGVLAFAAHGWVDVGGHRMGAIWPALFLAALLPLRQSETAAVGKGTGGGSDGGGDGDGAGAEPAAGFVPGLESIRRPGGGPVWAFRGLAVVLAGVGGWWAAGAWGMAVPPTEARVASAKARARALLEAKDYRGAAAAVTRALAWAPLDPALHFYRGMARLPIDPDPALVREDFQRARHFQPNNAEIAYREGNAWIDRQPGFALLAWEEALVRLRRQRTPMRERERAWYAEMLAQARELPELRPGLRALAGNHRGLLVAYLEGAGPEEFAAELENLLEEDPGLDFVPPRVRQRLFERWADVGDPRELARQVAARPAWMPTAWFALARVRADAGDYAGALALAREHLPAPALPAGGGRGEGEVLRRRFLQCPDDPHAGYAVYAAQVAASDLEGARVTVGKFTGRKGCPAYWHYLEAGLETRREDGEAAWKAWERYYRAVEPGSGR